MSRRNAEYSFAPSGLRSVFGSLTDGLRRGLYSSAASRLQAAGGFHTPSTSELQTQPLKRGVDSRSELQTQPLKGAVDSRHLRHR